MRSLIIHRGPLCERCGEPTHIIRKGERVLQSCSFCKGVELLRHSLRLVARASAAMLLLLALALPVSAEPITLNFTGTMTSGTGVGSFTYDPVTAAPTLVNVGGLANQVFTPFSWEFQLTSSFLPSQTFTSSLSGQTGSFCVGICTWLSPQQMRLNLTDGAGLSFHFSFHLTEPVATVPAYNQIGGFSQAVYQDNRYEGTTRVSVFQAGALSNGTAAQSSGSVPVPGTAELFGISMALFMLAHRAWKEVTGL